ncbi:hypothetical protein [Parabacteroides sp. AM08-6]|uniref:hypothetical protein n=1 Tax=Parabacteroides sp. AM08-6 TaxID=2292053 RepID=UPI001F29F965|nr:hypothetical protein [Parabacteroides sp. AM08-6]
MERNEYICAKNTGRVVKYLRNSIFKYLMVVLFLSYYVGGVAFTHVHHFATYTIIHSHPYLPGSDGQPQHSHSQEALDTIEILNCLLTEAPPVLHFGMVWLLLAVFTQPHTFRSLLRILRNNSLRAPPAYVLS